jgi:thioester reductase-like protein
MSMFVTGATGFIGRHLVEELLRNREGDVYVLVRAGSRTRLDALVERWEAAVPGARDRVRPVVGDLRKPALGVSDADVDALRGKIDHFFHLAAIYDLTAADEVNEVLNVDGTRHAVALAQTLQAGCLHHVSSVAAAGAYEGVFTEDMYDAGQDLPSPYHRTKFISEGIVRAQTAVPWRVYRPAVVVGHSRTGAMDKIDGPYYFLRGLRLARRALPRRVPLPGADVGLTNVVPVDFVARAIDHIAHVPGLDDRAFHLANPRSQPGVEVFNAFARAAGAPRMVPLLDRRGYDALRAVVRLPLLRELRARALAALGIPVEVIEHAELPARFDTTQAQAALAGTGIAVPELDTYVDRLWTYWRRELA